MIARGTLAASVGAIVAAAGLALAPAAGATFHLISVREVFPGSTANPGQDYVELQMYAPLQNFVAGHTLTIYEANGTAHSATFPADLSPSGVSQNTILIGAQASVLGVAPDLVDAGIANLDPAGGAACWASTIDCVAWGSFSGTATSPVGTPAPAITDGTALRRSIAPGCPTLLEAGDDTNDSATDFTLVDDPTPRNYASPITETKCQPPPPLPVPNTTITKAPKNRSRDRTPTWRFSSSLPGATFECRLDSSPFKACRSPLTRRVKPGKHTFRVRAHTAGGFDPSPAVDRFRVLRRRR